MLRTVVIYQPHLAEPVYPQDFALEDDQRVADALAHGAERYSSPNSTTIRLVMPGASHSTAWRHTLTEVR